MLFSMDQCYGWHSSSTFTWLTCKILTAPKFYSCKIKIAESEGCSLSLELDANLIEAQFHLQSKWMLLDWCSLNYVHNICLYWKHHILYVLDCSGSDLASRRIHLEFALIHDSSMGGLNSQLLYFKSGKRNLQESYSMSKVQSL